MGSIRVARRAGHQQANTAIVRVSIKIVGSVSTLALAHVGATIGPG